MSAIDKILIANRGEIACRIIRTAKRLGISTVAVYSEADRHSLHVSMADEAVCIGPAASAESYLVIENILQACQQTGAKAVHPGFGFLSENAAFAAALEKNGLVFIGPGIHAIEIMGDKIESKKLAASSGVNTVPGHPDALDSPQQALTIATEIGCPVMLKASAGGGGKGMRIAWTLDDVADNFVSAQNEARSAFGDDRVFVEKFIEQPRHIEIQILADKHGNCLALGERECSIQRRHQKVLEEAPSPFVDEQTRKAMSEQAVALAKAVDYHSAGTVEFIVDKDRNFYFLEMNTRLQVEHPVTEFVTGLDLVEQMINIAAGEPLALQQSDVKMTGWALEARVYAEDPDRNFMPSIGRLTRYQPPLQTDTVRVDTGVSEGGEISMYYDPMIAKLVTYGDTREQAVEEMNRALDAYAIRGVSHNIPFLSALVNHPAFKAGDLTTGFIDQYYPDGFDSSHIEEESVSESVALAAFAHAVQRRRGTSTQSQLMPPGTHSSGDTKPDGQEAGTSYIVVVGQSHYPVHVLFSPTDTATITVGVKTFVISSSWKPGQLLMHYSNGDSGKNCTAQIDLPDAAIQVTRNGHSVRTQVLRPRVADLRKLMPEKKPPDMSRFLLSPMPGLLIKVSVAVGDEVKAGQELAVVEAMKMENVLTADQDAIVSEIPCEAGSSLDVDQVIIEFE